MCCGSQLIFHFIIFKFLCYRKDCVEASWKNDRNHGKDDESVSRRGGADGPEPRSPRVDEQQRPILVVPSHYSGRQLPLHVHVHVHGLRRVEQWLLDGRRAPSARRGEHGAWSWRVSAAEQPAQLGRERARFPRVQCGRRVRRRTASPAAVLLRPAGRLCCQVHGKVHARNNVNK